MKKRLMAAILAASFMLGTGSIYGADEPKKGLKTKAMKQFDESVDRLKRCFAGKCTKMEALKAARDVGAAAVAVITVVYLGSKLGEAGARVAGPPQVARVIGRPAAEIGKVGSALFAPGVIRFRELREKPAAIKWAKDNFFMGADVQDRVTQQKGKVIGHDALYDDEEHEMFVPAVKVRWNDRREELVEARVLQLAETTSSSSSSMWSPPSTEDEAHKDWGSHSDIRETLAEEHKKRAGRSYYPMETIEEGDRVVDKKDGLGTVDFLTGGDHAAVRFDEEPDKLLSVKILDLKLIKKQSTK